MRKILMKILVALVVVFFYSSSAASAWVDKTHIAMGLAVYGSKEKYVQYAVGDPDKWFIAYYNLAAPDLTKIRADNIENDNNMKFEECNHYYDNLKRDIINVSTVLNQSETSGKLCEKDSKGRLYGAIVDSLRKHQNKKGGYAPYHLAYIGHYVGDLVNPLHNIDYTISKACHMPNDKVVEKEIDLTDFSQSKIASHMQEYTLNSEESIIEKMVELANESSQLGYKLVGKNKCDIMTSEEAYVQLGKGASLFKAILIYVGAL